MINSLKNYLIILGQPDLLIFIKSLIITLINNILERYKPLANNKRQA